MKIVACLAWYDEPIEFLDRCVRSLAGVADTLIAYDGAWSGYPGGACSSLEQHSVIRDAANDVALKGVTVAASWESQVEKRNALMRDASRYGDWLLVIDGDEYLTGANTESLRWLLQHTAYDVATITATRTSGERAGVPQPIRRLFRAPVTVERAHNGYRHNGNPPNPHWLNGDSAYVRLAKAADASKHLFMEHAYLGRGSERNEARMQYRMQRRRDRTEVWA